MDLTRDIVLFLAAALGGALNAVVGGGSFVTFPALLFAGTPAIMANATSSFVVWPAAIASTVAYRRELRQLGPLTPVLAAVSLIGGGVGAVLLLGTSQTLFLRLLPFLLLFATVVFTFGKRLLPGGPVPVAPRPTVIAVAALLQLVIACYGGYFGGGMGILMLAVLTLIGMRDIHRMNGLRSLLGVIINGVALIAFVRADKVAWRQGLIMAVGATLAGYLGAALSQRVDPRWVRRVAVAIAWAMTGYFFLRALLGSGALRT